MIKKISKLVAVALALTLCLSPSSIVFAAESNLPPQPHIALNEGTTVFSVETTSIIDSTDATSMTTEEIVDALINDNKMMLDVLYHISSENRYEAAKEVYPLLAELETRNDSSSVLTGKYNAIQQNLNNSTHSLVLTFLNYLLQYPSMEMIHSSTTVPSSVSPLAVGDIVKSANGFYYESIGYTYTRAGNSVELWEAQSDYPDNIAISISKETLSAFSGLRLSSPPTSLYNCHSYAWYNQSSSNPYWINDVHRYLSDPHSVLLGSVSVNDVRVGDIVVYRNSNNEITHSAVVYEITDNSEVTLISKWGADGLYIHSITNVPTSYTAYPFVLCDAYRLTTHSYAITSRNSLTHTQKCTTCNKTITEAHIYNALGVCKVCNFNPSGSTID